MDETQSQPPYPARVVRHDPTITVEERIRRRGRMLAASTTTAVHIAILREADRQAIATED
jgi:hypothetical protein